MFGEAFRDTAKLKRSFCTFLLSPLLEEEISCGGIVFAAEKYSFLELIFPIALTKCIDRGRLYRRDPLVDLRLLSINLRAIRSASRDLNAQLGHPSKDKRRDGDL